VAVHFGHHHVGDEQLNLAGVRFEAADRFPSMADVADALRPLIAAESLSGTVETPLAFGHLVCGSDGENDPEPCWLVG